MTAGLHHHWRRRAADLAGLAPGGRALDVATGTGDLALELARRVAPGGTVVGADFSERMLELARDKAVAERASGQIPAEASVRFEAANALALPYGDGEFDAATVGFGARNFSDLPRGLSEMARVVRPGGRVVVLEITTPTETAAVDLPRPVVRSHRPRARPRRRRRRRLQLSAQLGPALSAARGAGRGHVGVRPALGPLRAHRRGHHRAARGRGGQWWPRTPSRGRCRRWWRRAASPRRG